MRAARGGAARRARDRLHRAVDERLAGGGVHPDPADGRHRRPAVPRVRGDAVGGDRDLAGGLAHHHADDVRRAAAPHERRRPRAAAAAARARARRDGARLPRRASAGCSATRASMLVVDARSPSRSTSTLFVIVPKGFFPQQDTGRLTGAHPGGAGHLVPGDAGQARARWSTTIARDPAVENVIAFTGGGGGGGGATQHRRACSSTLKPPRRARRSTPTR